MRLWPRKEKRQGDYTQQATESLESVIYNGVDDGTQLAAVRFAAAMVGNAFANAEVSGINNLDSPTRQQIGSELVLRGEVLLVNFEGRWLPVGDYTIRGTSPIPEQWKYRLNLSAPDTAEPIFRMGSTVIHVRCNPDPKKHWKGVPAWKSDKSVKTAIAAESACGEAARTPVLTLLSLGSGFGSNNVMADTQRRLSGAFRKKSKTFLIRPENDSSQTGLYRLEPKIDPGLVQLRKESQLDILAQIGVPVSLFSTDSEGTGRRVALSQLTINCLQPMAKLVSGEFESKLGVQVDFDFSDLLFSDVQGKARAVGALVKAGVNVDEAMSQVGLE